jgi:hypothetical protein
LRFDATVAFELCEIYPQSACDLGELGAIGQRLIPVASRKVASDSTQIKIDTL